MDLTQKVLAQETVLLDEDTVGRAGIIYLVAVDKTLLVNFLAATQDHGERISYDGAGLKALVRVAQIALYGEDRVKRLERLEQELVAARAALTNAREYQQLREAALAVLRHDTYATRERLAQLCGYDK